VQEHLCVGLIRKPLLVSEILGSLDIGQREPHGDGLQGNSPPRLAGLQGAFHDLRSRFRMAVPSLGLLGFGVELDLIRCRVCRLQGKDGVTERFHQISHADLVQRFIGAFVYLR